MKFEDARHIADAAAFFDHMKNLLPDVDDKIEAAQHVDRLHTIAELYAGDRSAEIYKPHDAAQQVPA